MLAIVQRTSDTDEVLDIEGETQKRFPDKFISELSPTERELYAQQIINYLEKYKFQTWAILDGENWVKEKVAKSIEYYLKRIELIQTMLAHREEITDSQIRLTLKKDNFDILKDFSTFVSEWKIPTEPA